jgi:hypothetical protein
MEISTPEHFILRHGLLYTSAMWIEEYLAMDKIVLIK